MGTRTRSDQAERAGATAGRKIPSCSCATRKVVSQGPRHHRLGIPARQTSKAMADGFNHRGPARGSLARSTPVVGAVRSRSGILTGAWEEVIEAPSGGRGADEELRYSAAIVVLDGLLGARSDALRPLTRLVSHRSLRMSTLRKPATLRRSSWPYSPLAPRSDKGDSCEMHLT